MTLSTAATPATATDRPLSPSLISTTSADRPLPPLLPALRAYVAECWSNDAPTTISGAIRKGIEVAAADGAGEFGPKRLEGAMTALFSSLEKGTIAHRAPSCGAYEKRAIVEWNWSGLPAEGQTLRTLLDGWLRAPQGDPSSAPVSVQLSDGRTRVLTAVSPRDRQKTREALRLVLNHLTVGLVGTSRTDAVMLAAAERVPAADLRHLPGLAKAHGGAEGSELQRHLRNLLRYAVSHDLCVIHVPAPQEATPWAAWMHEHVPEQASARSWMYRLKDALDVQCRPATPATPDDATALQANAALVAIAAELNGERAVREIRSVLASLGLRGLGPYRELATHSSLVKIDDRHYAPYWCLGPVGATPVKLSWLGTRALLDAHGLPNEWLEFWDFYTKYSTMKRNLFTVEFPDVRRKAKRRLNAKTARQRHMAIRHWIGAAMALLGLAPEHCTIARVFGSEFQAITRAIRAGWTERVNAQTEAAALGLPVLGQTISEDSPSLTRHLINAGLIAQACAVWATDRAARDRPVASTEEIAAWHRSYEWTQEEVGEGETVFRARDLSRKNLDEIQGDLAGLALLPTALRRVRQHIERAPADRATAVACQQYLIGVFGAMGMDRIGECALFTLAHVRETTFQATGRQTLRYLVLQAAERKNGVQHQIPLLPELVPEWLWSYWTDTARPALMAPWVAAGHADHRYLLVSPQGGGPFGGLPDTSNLATAADNVGQREMNASSALGAQYRVWRRRELTAQGRNLELGHFGHHGPHAERARMVRLTVQVNLPAERASMLLGHEGNTEAARSYAKSLVEVNADTLRTILRAKPWLGNGEHLATNDLTVDSSRRRGRREQDQLARNAQLGLWLREQMLNRLDDLSASEALKMLLEGRRLFGVEPSHASEACA